MPRNSIRNTLAALTAALIGVPVVNSGEINRTETSILIYSEKDRARATEATFSLSKELKHQYLLDLRLTYDGLTGATPTGASPSKYAQTLTRASGGQTIDLQAGEFPVDENFQDTRFAADVAMSHLLGKETMVKLGTHLSSEHDYRSIGLSTTITHDFNRRNTTIGLGASIAHDVVKPVTGFYVPFSEVGVDLNETSTERRERFKGRDKNVYDVILSLAQVLDRRTVVRFSFSASRSSGHMTDPYKMLSIVQSPDSADPGEPVLNVYESRPDSRQQNVAFAELRKLIFGSATALSYRFYWDDWNVRSHTADVSLNLDLKHKGVMTPRVRWYRQSAADFHVPFLVEDDPLPSYASADSRLSKFTAFTYGLGYSVPVNSNSKINLGLEYYIQRGDVSPPPTLSSALNFDLFPKLDVVMVRLGYVHEFF
jgi:hypothetical protein